MSKTSDWVRETFGKTDTERDKGLTTPDDIVRYDNIIYGDDPQWQALDVYRPAKVGALPVIVSVHGGGWVYGDKERYQFYCMSLAQRGFAVVNFTYRLAPEVKFPASVEDTNLVFSWVLENADTYGFDTRYVFGVGDSAGAHNLAMFSAMCTNPEYAARFPFAPPEGFVPTAIALNCGAYWIAISDKPEDEFSTNLMADYLPDKGSAEELISINAGEQVTGTFPPTFLMTAEDDFLKIQAPNFAEKLLKNNVPFVYRYYREKERKLAHVFHLDIRLDAATLCNDEECAFFKSFVKWEHEY